MDVTETITAISVAIAAISFVAGVNAWKREYVGKRRIELVESVLAMFYEAEDAIREIRNPFSFGSEGKSRKRRDGETEEESELLDRANVVFERYEKREKLFAQLRSMKYRFMASFGADASVPFDELNRVLNDMLFAARILGTLYWPRQGRAPMTGNQFEKHLEEMHKQEAIFWYVGEETDEIGPRMRTAVEMVEKITQHTVDKGTIRLSSIVVKREGTE